MNYKLIDRNKLYFKYDNSIKSPLKIEMTQNWKVDLEMQKRIKKEKKRERGIKSN